MSSSDDLCSAASNDDPRSAASSDDEAIVPRPWGSFRVLHQDPKAGYKVKELVLNPGQRISLQYHEHRAEGWVVVAGYGTAEIRGPGRRRNYHFRVLPADVTMVPPKAIHRLSAGPEGLRVIETQVGTRLDEDDIVRLEDDFGRAPVEAVDSDPEEEEDPWL